MHHQEDRRACCSRSEKGQRNKEAHSCFVKGELFKHQQIPPVTNRRFHPKPSDIRNHMYQATIKHRLSKIDQENVASNLGKWKIQRTISSLDCMS